MVSIILKRQSKEQPTHAGDSAKKKDAQRALDVSIPTLQLILQEKIAEE